MSTRHYHLDALRSFCMLFGVFVHANTLGEFGALEHVNTVSDHFRMATFFLVSGILAALVLERRAAGAYITNRLENLGVPLVVGLILLNPVTLALIFAHHNPDATARLPEIMAASFEADRGGYAGPLIWHLHLWFLFSLLAMSIMAPTVVAILRSQGVARRIAAALARTPRRLHGVMLALAVVVLTLVLRIALEIIAPALNEVWLIRATLIYTPLYVAGIAIFTQPALWAAANRFDPVVIAAAALALALDWVLSPALPGSLEKLFGLSVLTFVRAAAALTLIAAFATVAARPSALTNLITRSIYTVYLLHFLLLYALTALLSGLGAEVSLGTWMLVSLGTMAIGIAVHFGVVERIAIVEYLLNGKRPRRARPDAGRPQQGPTR